MPYFSLFVQIVNLWFYLKSLEGRSLVWTKEIFIALYKKHRHENLFGHRHFSPSAPQNWPLKSPVSFWTEPVKTNNRQNAPYVGNRPIQGVFTYSGVGRRNPKYAAKGCNTARDSRSIRIEQIANQELDQSVQPQTSETESRNFSTPERQAEEKRCA